MRRIRRLPCTAGLALLPLVALLLAACGGDDDGEIESTTTPVAAIVTRTPAPEGTATTTPEATATPAATTRARPATTQDPDAATLEPEAEYTGHRIFGELRYGERIEFPDNLLMLIETGCAQCDGPTEALYRVWRNDGEPHVDLLFDAGLSEYEDAAISSYAVRPDLGDIVVGVCTEGPCQALNFHSGVEIVITFYRSQDGGLTWSELFASEPGEVVRAAALTDDGLVLRDVDGNLRYHEGNAVKPPEGATRLSRLSLTSGELLWEAAGGATLLNNDGRRVAAVKPGTDIGTFVDTEGPGYLASWRESGERYLTLPGPDGQLAGFRNIGDFRPRAELEGGRVLGNLTLEDELIGSGIGIANPGRAGITPLGGVLIEAPFGDGEHPSGRNNLLGALDGPFYRVTTTTDCQNIFVRTEEQSEVLTCAVDGTLVHNLGSTVTVGAKEWARVRLFDGREGFADIVSLTE